MERSSCIAMFGYWDEINYEESEEIDEKRKRKGKSND